MSWHELLRCPACNGELVLRTESLCCTQCGQLYPHLGGIPVLVNEPHATVDLWRYRVDDFIQSNEETRTNILAQLATATTLDNTRRRLKSLHQRLEDHRSRLLTLLEQSGLTPAKRTRAEPVGVPGEGSITDYYHQIHRDWGWQRDANTEAEEAAEACEKVLGDEAVGTVLVLGAGAGRLACDVLTRHGGTLGIAFDLNPLPFLVAGRLLAGEQVELLEFPVRPRTSHTVCVDRIFELHNPPPLHLVFANGLLPPVADASFDTVITPWFIDQIPVDMATLIPQITRCLRVGGRWLNFGPLVYHPAHTRLAHRYCIDEVLELAALNDLAVEGNSECVMRYMESPAGSQGRTERVFTFTARRLQRASSTSHDVAVEPAWLSDPNQPIPRFAAATRYRAPHPMFATILGLVDGKRSAAQIADHLVRHHGVPREAALGGVKSSLTEISRDLAAETDGHR